MLFSYSIYTIFSQNKYQTSHEKVLNNGGGMPVMRFSWIPAFAGMTCFVGMTYFAEMTGFAGMTCFVEMTSFTGMTSLFGKDFSLRKKTSQK